MIVEHDATTLAVVTVLAEGLHQSGTDSFPSHLHQPQGGDLSNLVAGAIATQAFDQAA